MAQGLTTGRPYFHRDRDQDGPKDGTVEPNTIVELLEDAPRDDYWQVRLADGRIGYIHKDLIQVLSGDASDLTDDTFEFLGRTVHRLGDESAFFFEAKMAVDADGAPNAYGPNDSGLDDIRNAGHPGNWWGIVTNNGESDGEPIIQGQGDPAPGFYVTATSLGDPAFRESDQRRYVDANRVPFIAMPPQFHRMYGVNLGDLAYVINLANGAASGAIFADTGPKDELGEGSIALADALGVPSSPRDGGASKGIVYVVFPGTSLGWPADVADIAAAAQQHFDGWGGMAKLTPFLT